MLLLCLTWILMSLCLVFMGRIFLARRLPSSNYRKVLILDLDETLIHSTSYRPAFHRQFKSLTVYVHNQCNIFHVFKRPHAELFLREAYKHFDLYIFTASIKEYADPVLDLIFPRLKALIRGRIYRESCVLTQGNYVKDLSMLGNTDLSSTIIVDNSPISYSRNESNAIPISNFFGTGTDEALLNLVPFLEALSHVKDVRSILGLRVALRNT